MDAYFYFQRGFGSMRALLIVLMAFLMSIGFAPQAQGIGLLCSTSQTHSGGEPPEEHKDCVVAVAEGSWLVCVKYVSNTGSADQCHTGVQDN